MPLHIDRGKEGEELAVSWLAGKNFTIFHRNWRYGSWEVDIIAVRDNVIHFIEVKYRHSGNYGLPEESVDMQKIRNMMRAAAGWSLSNRDARRIQYDVLSIQLTPDHREEYDLFEDISI